MPNRNVFLLIVITLIASGLTTISYLLPHKPTDPHPEETLVRIIENRGQWESPVRYKVPLLGGEVRIEANRWVYGFLEYPESLSEHGDPAAAPLPGDQLLKGHQVMVEEYQGMKIRG